MIVICIRTNLDGALFPRLTIGKSYVCRDLTGAKSFYQDQNDDNWVFSMRDYDCYSIIDDTDNGYMYYNTKLFKRLDDIREEKINKITNE